MKRRNFNTCNVKFIPRFKTFVDPYPKRAVLQVCQSVVSIISYTGPKRVSQGSGIIFEAACNSDNPNAYYVLTSAIIIRPYLNAVNNQRRPAAPLLRKSLARDDESNDEKPPTAIILSPSAGGVEINDSLDSVLGDKKVYVDQDDESSSETTFLVDNESSDDSSTGNSYNKIFVYLSNGEECEGEIFVYDDYYNIAVLKIESANQLSTAHLRPVDDSVAIGFCRSVNGQDSLKLVHGDAVVAVGRHYGNQHEIMATPGKYSVDEFDFDVKYACKDLLRANCKIDEFGIGGPLISDTGEVIGINFYGEKFTPFLPINIFLKWWEYYKVNQNHRRPWLGVEAAKLFAPPARVWESIRELNIFQGVVIKKVLRGSPAEAAGIQPLDIIVKCAGRNVRSFFELFEIIWDETGKVVDIEVIRNGISSEMKIKVEAL